MGQLIFASIIFIYIINHYVLFLYASKM